MNMVERKTFRRKNRKSDPETDLEGIAPAAPLNSSELSQARDISHADSEDFASDDSGFEVDEDEAAREAEALRILAEEEALEQADMLDRAEGSLRQDGYFDAADGPAEAVEINDRDGRYFDDSSDEDYDLPSDSYFESQPGDADDVIETVEDLNAARSTITAVVPAGYDYSARDAEEEDWADPWDDLQGFDVDEKHLYRNRVVTAARDNPSHTAFDVLRTRLLQALSENGWKRVAITSPTKDCGKTFTAANLAISLSRQENCRTLLLDCDMRRPSLHRTMGIKEAGSIGDMLRGKTSPQEHLRKLGRNSIDAGHNIAFGFNTVVEPYASELLQDPRCQATLNRIESAYRPDVMLFDLPPALYYDDVIAFRPYFDGILLVVGGGISTEKELKEVERRMGENTPLLGMILNRGEHSEVDRYRY